MRHFPIAANDGFNKNDGPCETIGWAKFTSTIKDEIEWMSVACARSKKKAGPFQIRPSYGISEDLVKKSLLATLRSECKMCLGHKEKHKRKPK